MWQINGIFIYLFIYLFSPSPRSYSKLSPRTFYRPDWMGLRGWATRRSGRLHCKDPGRDPFNQNSNRSDRENWSTSKGGPVFSKLFRLDRTDPLRFGPKFPEILVEWIARLRASCQNWSGPVNRATNLLSFCRICRRVFSFLIGYILYGMGAWKDKYGVHINIRINRVLSRRVN